MQRMPNSPFSRLTAILGEAPGGAFEAVIRVIERYVQFMEQGHF
jgi:hypothetical protein